MKDRGIIVNVFHDNPAKLILPQTQRWPSLLPFGWTFASYSPGPTPTVEFPIHSDDEGVVKIVGEWEC